VSAAAAVLAALGAVAVAVGVGMYSRPAGVITAGLLLIGAAYVVGYLEARREVSRRAR